MAIGLNFFVEGGVVALVALEHLLPTLGAVFESSYGPSGSSDGAGLSMDGEDVFICSASSDVFSGVVAVDEVRENDERGECVGGRMDCGEGLIKGPLELARRVCRSRVTTLTEKTASDMLDVSLLSFLAAS